MLTIKVNRIGSHAREITDRIEHKTLKGLNFLYNEKDLITGMRLYFTTGGILEIIQNTEPIDDEEEHDENPLDIELQEEDR